jgi:superfamily I DNA and/or RNA helicase
MLVELWTVFLSWFQEMRDIDGSYYNQGEIDLITWLVDVLDQFRVPQTNIGIIALYKAQAKRLQDFIKNFR